MDDKVILFVDDDPDILALYETVLTHAGVRHIIAKNGKDAEGVIQNQKPTLILLDIMLPDINGLDILKAIKANPQTQSIKVWMLSNLSDIDTRTKATELGADDYLVKANYTPSQILEKIKVFFEATHR